MELLEALAVLLIIGFCAALPSGRGVIVKPRPLGPRPKPVPIAPAAHNKQAITADTAHKGKNGI